MLVKPIENGEICVYTGCQFLTFVMDGVRKVFGDKTMPNNKINITVSTIL